MTRGIVKNVTIDGTQIQYGPDMVEVTIDRNERPVPTISDTHLFRDYVLAGLPDVEERYRIRLPMSGLQTDDEFDFMDDVRMSGGFHTLALWVPVTAKWTATASQSTFYLPRRRQDAAIALGFEAEYPATADIDGTDLTTITYIAGSSPSEPAAGTLNIASDPVTSGIYKDYVMIRVAAMTAGEVLTVRFYPLLQVYVESPRVSHPSAFQQVQELTMIER